MKKSDKIICLGFVLCILAAFWFIMPVGTDMQFHMIRIGELAHELSSRKVFPVYMFTRLYNHHGYPIPVFYGELFLYPGALLVMLGADVISVYKLSVIAVILLAFLSANKCLLCFCNDADIAFAGAFIYIMQPFFLSELFIRASLGAALVYIFIPIVLLGFYNLITEKDNRMITLCLGGGMAAIAWSHLLSTIYITFVLALVYIFMLHTICNKPQALIRLGKAVAAFALLSSAYLLPMLEQLLSDHYMVQDRDGFWTMWENPIATLYPAHLSTILSIVFKKEIPSSVTGGAVIPFLLLMVYLIASKHIRDLSKSEWILVITYIALHLSLSVKSIWSTLEPIIGFTQYIGRLYLVISCVGVMLALIRIIRCRTADKEFIRVPVAIYAISAAFCLVFFFGYFMFRNIDQGRMEVIVGHKITPFEYTTELADDLYIPSTADTDGLTGAKREVHMVTDTSPRGIIWSYSLDEESASVSLNIESNELEKETVFSIPFIMYQGYSAVNPVTGQSYEIREGDNGLVEIVIPPGSDGEVIISYTGTIVQRISLIITVITLFGCLLLGGVFPFILSTSKGQHPRRLL